MNMRVFQASLAEWAGIDSEKAHYATFGEFRSHELERFDFSLFAASDDTVIGYMNCKEMDSETIYFQMGGAFPDSKGSIKVVPACIAIIDWCLSRYERITARIENTNVRMLKIAFSLGFLVCGTWNYNGKIYLELLKQKDEGDGNRN